MDELAYRAILRRLGVGLPAERCLPDSPSPALDSALVSRLLGMPLDRFAREGCPVEVRVPWLEEATLWFVPTQDDVEILTRQNVSRGRIWTAREIQDLLTIPRLTAEPARTIARAKLEFGGEVVEIRRRDPGQ